MRPVHNGSMTTEGTSSDTGTAAAAAQPRYRCTACGNLTRFDVVSTRRSRAFHHYSVGGELEIEDTEVLEEHIEDVICRWCGTGSSVEVLDRDDPTAEERDTSEPPEEEG